MSKNNLLYLGLGIIVLVGLFFFLKPKSPSNPSSAPTSNHRVFDLKVTNRKLEGDDTLTVSEGDNVTFNVLSDENEELHLHGYDKSVDLEASKEAQLNFTADKTGRFPFELEHSKTELGALEVQPK